MHDAINHFKRTNNSKRLFNAISCILCFATHHYYHMVLDLDILQTEINAILILCSKVNKNSMQVKCKFKNWHVQIFLKNDRKLLNQNKTLKFTQIQNTNYIQRPNDNAQVYIDIFYLNFNYRFILNTHPRREKVKSQKKLRSLKRWSIELYIQFQQKNSRLE